MSATPKYRPSNATEGELFWDKWCGTCEHERAFLEGDSDPCEIIGDSMLYGVDEPEYPAELVGSSLADARCTAWTAEEGAPEPRCAYTMDMFGESPR